MVYAPISTVNFKYLKLAREAANNYQATCYCLVDLHNASDIVLAILKPYLPLIFSPI
jgi:hypothetical protein